MAPFLIPTFHPKGSPFSPLNANAKDGFSTVPLFVTDTEGFPIVLLTLAVADIVGVAPVSPVKSILA